MNMEHNSKAARNAAVATLYIAISILVVYLFLLREAKHNHRAGLPEMVYGYAHRPFCYRLLMPSIIRFISRVTPQAIRSRLENSITSRQVMRELVAGWEEGYHYEHIVAALLYLACFVGFAYCLRRAIKQFYQCPSFVVDIAPCFPLLFIPFFFQSPPFVYDPATVLLSALFIVVLGLKNLVAVYVTFVAACLNKETSILMVALFIVHELGRRDLKGLITHGGFLSAIWIGIRAQVVLLFRDNPGSVVECHLLGYNARILRHPTLYFLILIPIAAVCVALVANDWRNKPAFLKHGFLITAIPLFILTALFGIIDEIRVYYEVYPFLFLLALPTVARIFNIPLSSQAGQSSL